MKAQEEAMCASVPKSIEWPLESMRVYPGWNRVIRIIDKYQHSQFDYIQQMK